MDVVLTDNRLQVLKMLVAGRTLLYRPAMLHQAEGYRWAETGMWISSLTVKPLERAGLITVHPADYYKRIITPAGRAALTAQEGA